MILVSVVLCSNQLNEYFYKAVESILTQNFSDFELLIVLNGQALLRIDDLKKEFSPHENIKIIGANISGLTYSLNVGLDHASGKYVARMDADDISYPDRLKTQFNFLEKNSEICVCGSAFHLIDSCGLTIKFVSRPTSNSQIRKNLFYKNPLCHPTVMYRIEAIRAVGGYETGSFSEDYNLWVRLARDSHVKFANIDTALLGYRHLSTGEARGSKEAYASVSSTQWHEFINTGSVKWLVSAILSIAKATFLGK
ncbi:glycosyltransferase [Polynucleobacter paneuropaeus]|jgi:cellulose synthase/poly-beta-1,6-N-acetylglucosamine synthase-like glycosyltransferase|nr:glycosyltransferase [Polynucleobacter paneuropaeus]